MDTSIFSPPRLTMNSESANFTVNNVLNKDIQVLNIERNPGITVKAGPTIKFAENEAIAEGHAMENTNVHRNEPF